ncbi:MAG: peptidyl-prolyl cis-trans isomerase [Deltaproteobacteria bacterium]|nr:peptidyl-prolyl cis-trans isomerase [Deltaproteobacteria bacterium]
MAASRRRARARRPGAAALGRWVAGVVLWAAIATGCNEDALVPAADGGPIPGGLTPAQAAQVVARVGDRAITLGDFAATLERMNQYDRLRYQTKEQRRQLLDEMIDNELLAQEAVRQGLNDRDQVQQAIRQILRDAILARARRGLPSANEIPQAEVRKYYEENEETFREPERRRVSAIVLDDREAAEAVLDEARKIRDGAAWGKLFYDKSTTAPAKPNPTAPADLAGDLGIVGPVGDKRGANRKVPVPVQRAVFELEKVGDVYDEVVEADGRFYVVRMSGRTAGHTRSLSEAERSIRIRLLQENVRRGEQALVDDLRKRIPVVIDEDALRGVKVPSGATKPSPPARPAGQAEEGAEGDGAKSGSGADG